METATTPVPGVKISSSQVLDSIGRIAPILSQHVEDEEKIGRLSAPVIDALRAEGFFKLFLPRSLGGLEIEPLTMANLVEEVAYYNTAAGWSLMVANTTLPMLSRIPEKGIEEIFDNKPDVFIAGTVHPPMMATRTDGGYLINGRNPLVSNIHEAQWIMALALVMEGEKPKFTNGHPEILGIYMRAKDCRIVDTWTVVGMHATDSNDVEAKDVFVPDHRLCMITPQFTPGRNFKGPLYKIPAACANIACLLAPVTIAVAQNAINELKVLASKKTPLGSMVPLRERGVMQRKLARAEALVQSSRSYLHEKIAQCWLKIMGGESVSLEEKAGLLLASTYTNQSCVEAVELMYTAAGTSGIYLRNKLAHYVTDAQVLRQHGFMNESRYETAGQVYFGLAPDLPIIEL
ncbi:MAG TPA: acyl-CoA dehydrogenase family protein [Chitinophagaceae bacterium]|jgi:alkylation response protein AidB-like acyl-CoA dehydrogenase|nr:acyl-CoA dehydrogenase family protein [Chitinophagaceae bacterium]